MKLNDIEFRWSEGNNRYELIRWFARDIPLKPACITISFFIKGNDGYKMETVWDRFFDDEDAFKVGKLAMQFLEVLLEREEERSDQPSAPDSVGRKERG